MSKHIIITLYHTATEATSWIKHIVMQKSAIVKYCITQVVITQLMRNIITENHLTKLTYYKV